MKQTAVEWLRDQIASKNDDGFYIIDSLDDVVNVFKQAKEMEKQQIIQAYSNGYSNGGDNYGYGNRISPEQYYNETFKNK